MSGKTTEQRLTKIESDISHIRGDIAELKTGHADLKAGQSKQSEAIAELKGMLTAIVGLPDKVEQNSKHIHRIYGGIAVIVFLAGIAGLRAFL